jgi:hypothetical protein
MYGVFFQIGDLALVDHEEFAPREAKSWRPASERREACLAEGPLSQAKLNGRFRQQLGRQSTLYDAKRPPH